MKKIFTLISMAMVAMSMNAQEIWTTASLTFAEEEVEPGSNKMVLQDMTKSANTTVLAKKVPTVYNLPEGAQPTEDQAKADATETLQMDDYIFTGSTENVTLTGVSTPNTGTLRHEIWKLNGADNVKLNETNLGEQCLVPFDNQYIVAGNGNPALEEYEYYFTNTDPKVVGPRYYETFWTLGCGSLPLKGCYYKFSVKTTGTLIIGFFLNKNLANNNLILLDGATKAPVAQDKIEISAFRQNCNYEGEKRGEEAPVSTHAVPYTLDENYLISSQYEQFATDKNRPLYGYLMFDTEADKDYYMFSPKSQMGVYGFYFQAAGTGIDAVKTVANKVNAPMYNLAGQQVDNNFKGIAIQNGRKVIVK